MMNKSIISKLILATVLLLAGVGAAFQFLLKDSITNTFKPNSAQTDTVSVVNTVSEVKYSFDWTDEALLRKAEQDLINKLGVTKDHIFILKDIHFYEDGRINLEIQNPGNPDYVDEYHYEKGEWQESKPVVTSVKNHWKEDLFSLGESSFAAVSSIAKAYNEKASLVTGAQPVSHIYLIKTGKDLRWYPRSLKGDREIYSLEFDLNGRLILFERD